MSITSNFQFIIFGIFIAFSSYQKAGLISNTSKLSTPQISITDTLQNKMNCKMKPCCRGKSKNYSKEGGSLNIWDFNTIPNSKPLP